MHGINLYISQLKNSIWIRQKIIIKAFNDEVLFEGFSKDIPEYLYDKDISCIYNEKESLIIKIYYNHHI